MPKMLLGEYFHFAFVLVIVWNRVSVLDACRTHDFSGNDKEMLGPWRAWRSARPRLCYCHRLCCSHPPLRKKTTIKNFELNSNKQNFELNSIEAAGAGRLAGLLGQCSALAHLDLNFVETQF